MGHDVEQKETVFSSQVGKSMAFLNVGGKCVEGSSAFRNMHGYLRYTGKTYDGACSFFGGVPPLPQGAGYGICLGIGTGFAFFVAFAVWFANRGQAADHTDFTNSEVYTTAGRSIGVGLTAADVVSKWTWAATLLQSSNVAWQYGVSGPYWYASGATIQVLLFAILAIEIKRKCPGIHTMLEIVLARWGVVAHITFLIFGFMTNIIVTAMLILGGAATMEALTGMSTYAACFCIPVPVSFYTAFGGLKGTYYASFTHTCIIYLALLIFIWKIYAGPSDLQSSNKMRANLICASYRDPAGSGDNTWNLSGQYITMRSTGGLMFGVINTVGNFGTVFIDQSYWQGAIACKPSATYKGYLLGGMAWFAIPFSMATSLGLAARALDLPVTGGEAGSGLVPPAVGVHLMGPGGAFLLSLQLFLAITSTANCEMLAVASLTAYDIYKRYINPNATGTQMIIVSRIMVFVWGVISGCIAIILFELKIGLGWVYCAMGNFIGSAVFPMSAALLWKDCSSVGAIAGAWLGLAAAIIAWCVEASKVSYTDNSTPPKCVTGIVNVITMGTIGPQLAGNLVALFTPCFVTGVISLAAPQNYDWKDLREKTDAMMIETDEAAKLDAEGAESEEALTKVYWLSCVNAVGMTTIMIFLWPALALPAEVFTPGYFGWWVAIAFIWAHFAFAVTVLLPIYEFIFPSKGYDRWGNKISTAGRVPTDTAKGMPSATSMPSAPAPTGFFVPTPAMSFQQQPMMYSQPIYTPPPMYPVMMSMGTPPPMIGQPMYGSQPMYGGMPMSQPMYGGMPMSQPMAMGGMPMFR
jgi:SSS family transporter